MDTKFKKGNIPFNKGKHHSKKTREKMSETRIGNPSNVLGRHWKIKDTSRMKEKIFTKEHRENLRKSLKKLFSDKTKHPRWEGGISENPYPNDWGEILKESIRQRDNYIYQLCGIHQDELDLGQVKKLDIHHIDYDKNNIKPENLISLCRSCHVKTNGNRDYWFNYFTTL